MFFVKNERRIGQETANWAKMSWVSDESGLTLADEMDVHWFMKRFPGCSPPGMETKPDWSPAEYERALGLFLHKHGPHMEDDEEDVMRLMGPQKPSAPQASSSLVRKASDADLSPRKNTVPKKKKQLARKSANSETTAPKLAKSRKGGANRV
ncbi:hypothetical protein C8J57DRAFT_1245467 [Mycena rebaudengoi]|nr:hypothetical protein C8J57DRAFT_1245467 [Mycena rebaudengoi]